MDKKPDGADMVIQLFGKCQRLPDQTRHTVTQGVVEAFDVVGKAAVFTCRDMAVFGEDLGIGLPIVRVADGRLSVGFGQRVPQSLRARPAAVTDMHADDGAGLPVQSQPDPLLVAFVADERPQLVAFQAKAGSVPVLGHPARHPLVNPVYVGLQPPLGHLDHAGDARQGDTLQQQSANHGFLPRGNPRFLRVGHKLPLAVLATVLLASCQRADAVFDNGIGVAAGTIHRGEMGLL